MMISYKDISGGIYFNSFNIIDCFFKYHVQQHHDIYDDHHLHPHHNDR